MTPPPSFEFEAVIVGGTPAGIMTGISVAKAGRRAVILERSAYIGGLPANGLGATDIHTRGATGGLFLEFIGRVKQHYSDKYGADSQQVIDCSDGYRFEPHVAEMILHQMIAEQGDLLEVRTMRQFNHEPSNAIKDGAALSAIKIINRESGAEEIYRAKVFVDATYEGDLAAAAGAPYMLGREGANEYGEPCAGKFYQRWDAPVDEYHSTGQGDNAVQSYNYRLALTDNPANLRRIQKPPTYHREEFVSLIDDVRLNRFAGPPKPLEFDGIGAITNMARLPNDKVDGNNQHAAFISTDLPEENWPYPTASWDWRDRFAQRLRDYILGLFYFAQNDPELPADFRERCNRWGLARDEFSDNDNFPRQIYVREGRRIRGEYLFTAHDALSKRGARAHITSITASHYALDSHACLKREEGRPHTDGIFTYPTTPYCVPYGVIVPLDVENLLIPAPASGTHIGFSTLRMEPCWMALGEAAGIAINVSLDDGTSVREANVIEMQRRLLAAGAVLTYYEDAAPGDDHYEALQFFALRGFLGDGYQANLNQPVSAGDRSNWTSWANTPALASFSGSRGQLLDRIYSEVGKRTDAEQTALYAIAEE
ncbi:MAG: FAD-dependent oxidoreductase [Chloroflexota bacterium]|nr:FAD-dependent oxidoreductase [Chloroflexota bacterium]MDE2948949.1 FAD-dependent oxidoreductase [Chloroflexota bacterium]